MENTTPKPRRKRLRRFPEKGSCTLPAGTTDRLDAVATARELAISELIREYILRGLEQAERRRKPVQAG